MVGRHRCAQGACMTSQIYGLPGSSKAADYRIGTGLAILKMDVTRAKRDAAG